MSSPPRLLLACFLVIGLNCGGAVAQDRGRVEGRVLSASTEVPVTAATVEVIGEGRSGGTTTDDDGRFVLGPLPAGPTELEIRHVGHVPAVRTVQVQGGKTTRVTVALERDVVELSGLEITSRSEAAQASFPGATFTVDAAELEQGNPIGLQETLLSVPGVFGRADDGMGQTRMSISIRGLQSRRTQRVLVMEDGVPIQPAPYIFSPLYYNPPVERIEKTEIIKGSSSIRHGPQTMAGVINFVTGRPQRRTPGGELKVTGGSHRYGSVFAEVGGFGTADLRPQMQLLVKRGDGFRDNNDFFQLNGTAKLQYDLDDDQSLYLKANVDYEDMNATYHGLTPHSFETNPDFNPKDDDSYRILRGAFDAIYNHDYGGGLRSTTKFYGNVFDRPWWREENVFVRADDYEQNGAAAEPVPPTTPGDLVRVAATDVTDRDRAVAFGNERTFYVTGLEHSFDIDHSLFGRSASLETGARLHYERFEDNNKVSDDPEARDGVFFRGDRSSPPVTIVGRSRIYETQALALYGLEEIQVGPLTLSPGVRLELFSQSSTDRLDGNREVEETNVVPLPSLGANLDLGRYDLGGPLGNGQFNLFGGVHRGYTSPSSATFLTLGVNDPNREAAFDLQAEKSWNSELGLRGRTRLGEFQFTGFYTYVEDLVGGKTRFTQNLGVVQSYGLESSATLKGDVVAGILPTLDASYTFMQTEVVEGIVPSAVDGTPTDISGNELIAAPTHTATVGLTKTFSDLGLTLRSTLRYRGEFYTDLENLERTSNRGEVGPVPSHTVLDAGATYEYSDDVRLNLTVKNVTDNVYIGSRLHSNPRDKGASSNGGSTGILPGPRRQINLSVQYDF
ncbi:TonB-dependent receptor [Salinibacter altiplanensis]|uniref:TonB-dependent receptor n=1 Tax=Salinibacter altiplanensis TaxID=1803181 RepID=UPI000C9F92FE|nr:TonB-dependent receptor [Salinibacter altiplanensis]